jgi:hypothetical protein
MVFALSHSMKIYELQITNWNRSIWGVRRAITHFIRRSVLLCLTVPVLIRGLVVVGRSDQFNELRKRSVYLLQFFAWFWRWCISNETRFQFRFIAYIRWWWKRSWIIVIMHLMHVDKHVERVVHVADAKLFPHWSTYAIMQYRFNSYKCSTFIFIRTFLSQSAILDTEWGPYIPQICLIGREGDFQLSLLSYIRGCNITIFFLSLWNVMAMKDWSKHAVFNWTRRKIMIMRNPKKTRFDNRLPIIVDRLHSPRYFTTLCK